MKTEIIYTQQQQGFLNLLEKLPKYWAEYKLDELEDTPQFNRKLGVIEYGVTSVEDGQAEMFSVTIEQEITRKTDGSIYKLKKEKVWYIYKTDRTVPGGADDFVKVKKVTLDDEGNEIESEMVDFKVPSIKYIKFLLLNKQAHLTDILAQFMKLYYETFKDEIDII